MQQLVGNGRHGSASSARELSDWRRLNENGVESWSEGVHCHLNLDWLAQCEINWTRSLRREADVANFDYVRSTDFESLKQKAALPGVTRRSDTGCNVDDANARPVQIPAIVRSN
jgi:hypothetical protein